ncbi:MAG: LapA family protein [Anaerolineales bacterium]
MQIWLIISLVIAILAVIFAFQNGITVPISFFVWQTERLPLALVLLIATAAGFLISLFASMPTLARNQWNLSQQKRRITDLEKSLDDQKARATNLETHVQDYRTRLEGAEKRLKEIGTSLTANDPK